MSELHDAKPAGSFVGQPTYVEKDRRARAQYAFDTLEGAKAVHRVREWTGAGRSELEVVREMARCLRLIREGRVPE